MSLDFTALDFETANSNRGSACSVGLVKVRDGEVVDRAYWFIKPSPEMGPFASLNVAIHGISAETVADAPPWSEIAPSVFDFVGGDTVVAHNAHFDMSVLRQTSESVGLAWPTLNWMCSLAVARRTLDLPYYRLPFVADACGVELANHHDADDDALAAAMVMVALAEMNDCDSLADLAVATNLRFGSLAQLLNRPNQPVGAVYGRKPKPPEPNPDADPSHPLYGRVLVVTGTLTSMIRPDAWAMCAEVGAIPQENVTKRTNILVVGEINPASLAPGRDVTGKAAKAFALQAQGQQIELMTEDDLLRAL